MRRLPFLLLMLPLVDAAVADEASSLARGRELTDSFLAGDTGTVWRQMDPVMQRFLQSEDAFSRFRGGATSELGEEAAVVSETVQEHEGFTVYERTSRWSAVEAPHVLRWEFSDDGTVFGFGITEKQTPSEPAPTRHLDYITKATLRLPFDGEWMVFWGGRSVEQNIHATQQQQRFAYDFAAAVDGSMREGTGLDLADYHCWGKPIHAPADGKVVSAVSGLPDQPIGTMDKRNLAGNYLILDLGDEEYAMLAHFRQNTLRVVPGDIVRSGDVLGQCGNSGNTTQPHLHFHIQNSPRFAEGDGLPVYFVDYVADGKPVSRGEPVKGQLVHNR